MSWSVDHWWRCVGQDWWRPTTRWQASVLWLVLSWGWHEAAPEHWLPWEQRRPQLGVLVAELLVAEVYTPVDWWTWDPPSARSSSAASSLISASQHLLLLLIRHRILSTNKHCHSKHNTFLTFLFAQARGGKHIFRHLDGGWKLYPQLLKLKTQKSIMFSISFALYKNFVPSCWC